MRGQMAQRLLNVGLRMTGMGSRFLLTLVLARLLEPSELGMLGLLFATISFGVMFIGGDYYTHSLRELLSSPRERWSFVLQHQILATGILYAFFLPLLTLLFVFDLLPVALMGWFFILLLIDHIVQEINRLLVAMHRPLLASCVLFVRMGAWVWVVMPIMWLVPESRNYESVFIGWLGGGTLAIAIGIYGIAREAAPWHFWNWDRAWLLRGFGVGLMFLVATLCFKALTTVDRFVVEALNSMDVLGVYVFYVSLTTAVLSILDAAVFSFLYPRLVRAQREGDNIAYRHIRREMIWATLGASIGLAVLIAFFTPFLVEWIGRPLYAEHQHLLWLLLIGTIIYCMGMIPHYGLYARGADRSIFVAHVSSLFVFVIVTAMSAKNFPMEAAALGLLAAFSWLGGLKLVQYLKCLKQDRSVYEMPAPLVGVIGQ